MVAKLSKISKKFQKMRAAKFNHYDHVAITMYTTHRCTRTHTTIGEMSECIMPDFFRPDERRRAGFLLEKYEKAAKLASLY